MQKTSTESEKRAGKRLSKPVRYLCILALIVVAFLSAQLAGQGVSRYRNAQVQRDAVDFIRQLEANVYYDYQDQSQDGDESLANEDEYPGSKWLVDRLGKDFLHQVFYVNFAQFQSDRVGGQQAVTRSNVTDVELDRLHELPGLRWVALNGAAITDAGLKKLASLPSLERLWLTQTGITDNGLLHLRHAQGLTHLFLNGTLITDRGLAYVAELPNLRVLNLSAPQLTDRGFAYLQNLPGLTTLYLDGTQLSDAGLTYVCGLSQLEMLSLRGTRISDTGAQQLRELDLKELLVDGTQIADVGIAACKEMGQLKRLSLQGTRVTNAGLIQLESAVALETLGLAGSACTLSGVIDLVAVGQKKGLDAALEAIAEVKRDEEENIVSLDLSTIRVTDDDLARLSELVDLQWLSLYGSEVTDEGLSHLSGLPKLTLLNLTKTGITDDGVAALGRIGSLRTVHLTETKVTPSGVERLLEETGGSLRIYTREYSPFSSAVTLAPQGQG
jgi:internalin A